MDRYAREKVDQLFEAKLRLGRRLLLCFVAVYFLFVTLHVLSHDWLALPVAGVNLGLFLGVALLVVAVVVAVAFHLLSCRLERKFAQQLQGSVAEKLR